MLVISQVFQPEIILGVENVSTHIITGSFTTQESIASKKHKLDKEIRRKNPYVLYRNDAFSHKYQKILSLHKAQMVGCLSVKIIILL